MMQSDARCIAVPGDAFDWTKDRERELIRLWYGALSTPAIAARLGVSKNAVIGKAHGMGLGDRVRVNAHGAPGGAGDTPARAPGAGATPARPARIPTPSPPSRVRDGAGEAGRVSAVDRARQRPPGPEPVRRVGRLKPLAELEPGDCRFPIGDVGQAGFGFCGRRAAAERPYCAEHCAVAYVRGRKPDMRESRYDTGIDRWRHW